MFPQRSRLFPPCLSLRISVFSPCGNVYFFVIEWSIYDGKKKSYSTKKNSLYLRIICFRSRNSKRRLTFNNVTSISTAVRCIMMTHINYPNLSKMQNRTTTEKQQVLFSLFYKMYFLSCISDYYL